MREHTSKPVYLGTEIAAFCPKNFECQMLVSVLGTNINYSLYVKGKGIRTNLWDHSCLACELVYVSI